MRNLAIKKRDHNKKLIVVPLKQHFSAFPSNCLLIQSEIFITISLRVALKASSKMYQWEVNSQFTCVTLERLSENSFSWDNSVKDQASEIIFISDGNYIFSTSEARSCLSWHHNFGEVKWSTFPELVHIRLYTVIPACLAIYWTYKTLLLWSVKKHQSFFHCHLKILGGLKGFLSQKPYPIGL